ncbi:MAG: serine hydrolase, partial [Planctomycetaceae bacterium]
MRVLKAVVVLAILLGCSPIAACTIFCFSHNGKTYFCNNEDWSDSNTEIRFHPATEGSYAWVFLGFSNNWAQGGVNEHGLCFDWVAGGGPFGWKADPNKQDLIGNLSEEMLRTCRNVEEVIAFYKKYNERHLDNGRTLVADKSGKSVLIRWANGKLVFERSNGHLHSCGVGKKAVDLNLQSLPQERNVARLVQSLSDASNVGTKYSNIFSLSEGKLILFQHHNYSEYVEIDYLRKLKEPESRHKIASLFRRETPVTRIVRHRRSLTHEDHESQIKHVETNLSSGTRFRGDSGWNIEDRMDHYGVPGVSIAVVENYQVVWSKAWGVKNLETAEPLSPNTLFQCASISKPVSAAAALHMVEKGLFTLDQDVNEYLTSWTLPKNEFTRERNVTLRHLLSHTGGLTVHGFPGYAVGESVPSLTQVLNGSGAANTSPIRVDKVPGGSFRYSGGGYCVLQQMMMDTAGKTFPDIMYDTVLSRTGMNHSTFQHPLPTVMERDAATGYLPNGKMVTGRRHTYPEMAPAGLYASAPALARFFIELQKSHGGQQGRLLSPKMTREMLAVPDSGMGLGMGVSINGDEVYFGHGGWNEGFSSKAHFHRDRGYGVVVLTNSNHPPLIEEIINSVARTYHWHNHSLPEYDKREVAEKHIQQVVGRYDHHGNLIRIYESDGGLVMETDGESPVSLFRVGQSQFASPNHNDLVCVSPEGSPKSTEIAFRKPWEKTTRTSQVARRLAEDEKLAIEFLRAGEFEAATTGYLALQEKTPDQPSIQESYLNDLGYQFI